LFGVLGVAEYNVPVKLTVTGMPSGFYFSGSWHKVLKCKIIAENVKWWEYRKPSLQYLVSTESGKTYLLIPYEGTDIWTLKILK